MVTLLILPADIELGLKVAFTHLRGKLFDFFVLPELLSLLPFLDFQSVEHLPMAVPWVLTP